MTALTRTPTPHPDRRLLPRITWLLLGALLLMTLVVLGCHLYSIVHDGELGETTGFEGVQIYNVWKWVHGLAVYEFPNADPYNVAPYNLGFYATYGGVLRALHVPDRSLTLAARILTIGFTAIGAAAMAALINALAPKLSIRDQTIAILLAICAWFGQLVSWQGMTVRPDVPAVALEMVALALLAARAARPSYWRVFSAALLFAAAWLFKQNMVGTLGGAAVYVWLLRRDFRRSLLLVLPTALAIVLALTTAGANYRYNIITVQSVFPLSLHGMVMLVIASMLVAPLYWGLCAVVIITGAASEVWGSREDTLLDVPPFALANRITPAACLLLCATGAALLTMLPGMAKVGAARTYAMESTIPAAALAAVAIIRCMDGRNRLSRRVGVCANLLLSAMIGFALLQFAGSPKLGRPTMLTAAERVQRERLLKQVTALPQPFYINDKMLALPWYATNGQYPAFVLDRCYLPFAQLEGRVSGEPLEQRIASRWFKALLIDVNDPLYPVALRSGYVPQSTPDNDTGLIALFPPTH